MAKSKTQSSLGLALDLGTTVIKGCAVNLKTGAVVAETKIYNLQNWFGSDVITRISTALQGKYKLLRRHLLSSIIKVKKELNLKSPVFTTVVGNSVMLSFYLNKPVNRLAFYPFESEIKSGTTLKNPARYIFPVIGGFVGGDTIAGIMASRLNRQNKNSLYIDLGTNGEVVLIAKRKIFAVSTAAGPAFEGVGISCGSLAVPGAIDRVTYQNNKFVTHTINNESPVGICASGIIDILGILLEECWLKDDGRLLKAFQIGNLTLNQKDARKIQLAIGAVHSGIKILLKRTHLKVADIDEAVITGEFGARLNIKALVRIGLLPDGIKKVRLENDLPIKGAIMALVDKNKLKEVETIQKSSTHIELANEPNFQKIFVQSLRMTKWN